MTRMLQLNSSIGKGGASALINTIKKDRLNFTQSLKRVLPSTYLKRLPGNEGNKLFLKMHEFGNDLCELAEFVITSKSIDSTAKVRILSEFFSKLSHEDLDGNYKNVFDAIRYLKQQCSDYGLASNSVDAALAKFTSYSESVKKMKSSSQIPEVTFDGDSEDLMTPLPVQSEKSQQKNNIEPGAQLKKRKT